MEFEREKKIRMHLEIAPLVDIVLLLLVFFMLTSNFIMQPGIKITLPRAKTARPQPPFLSNDYLSLKLSFLFIYLKLYYFYW